MILAKHLGVIVRSPEDVPGLSDVSLRQLTSIDPEGWSAVTLKVLNTRLVIVNSAHTPARQRSSLAHEFAHLILEHEPGRIDVSKKGHLLLSSYEKEQEEEAEWLSGALLVPRAGLVRLFRSSQDDHALAGRFGVSESLIQWRLRMTGILVQARRASAYRSTRVPAEQRPE